MGSGPPVLFCLGTWVQLTETPDTSTDGHGTVKSPTHALLIRSRAGVLRQAQYSLQPWRVIAAAAARWSRC